MGWRELLHKEIRIPLPGLPFGWSPRLPYPRPVSWFMQFERYDVRSVFVQIASIVSTNASLPHGLRVCAKDAPNRRVRRILDRLADETESGLMLGDAMRACRGRFRPHWIGLVLAGERTGSLPRAIDSILAEIDEDAYSGRLARSRLGYFGIVIVFQLMIMSFVASRILPVFNEILDEYTDTKPQVAGAFFSAWKAIEANYLFVLIGLVVAALLMLLGPTLYRGVGFVQGLVTHLVLPMPVFGPLFRANAIQRLCATLHVLLRGGMPMPDALRQAADGGLPRPFARAIRRAAESVELGVPLSAALDRNRRLFGGPFLEYVKLGESRQDLTTAFEQARDLFRRKILRRRRALVEALVPAGVAVCGSGVLFAMFSVFSMLIALADGIVADL